MRSVEISARTVDEAVEIALKELDAERDQVKIEVLDEGAKGLFGLLGGKQARVLVSLVGEEKQAEKEEAACNFLAGLLDRLGAKAEINKRHDESGNVILEISGDNLGMIIGRRGQMLDAVQYLVNVVANRQGGEWVRFILDAEGYRQRREEALRSLALRTADKVKTQGKRIVLEPMNAAERRIIHLALAEEKGVETHSEGDDPYRRVVIAPKKN
ncbi:MAG TPA: protein jag [Firmicutes bacterium]|nr:protein jag [Bacillota bacterium]